LLLCCGIAKFSINNIAILPENGSSRIFSAAIGYFRQQSGISGSSQVFPAAIGYLRQQSGISGSSRVPPAAVRYLRPQSGISGSSRVSPAPVGYLRQQPCISGSSRVCNSRVSPNGDEHLMATNKLSIVRSSDRSSRKFCTLQSCLWTINQPK